MEHEDGPARRKRILASYRAALGQPASNRAHYLAEACADDPQLRLEVEALLTASSRGTEPRLEGDGEVYRQPFAAAPASDPAPRPQDEASRRPLTVLFCDLVGSTELSQRLDAEDYHALITQYHDEVAGLIERYGGHIAQYLGDGILACFGYPQAHDNDAERAVRAGHDLVAALRRLDQHVPQPGLAVRVGIHTGPVVMKPPRAGRAETLMIGQTINVASRLQTAAQPQTVLISEATLKLVPGLFITRDLGTPELKGLSQPLRVYQVLQPSGVRSPLEAAERLTPLVGREAEQALLLRAWTLAQAGQGQAVLLRGEPGLGKSRLLLELRRQLADQPHTWLECGASPQSRDGAYQPIIELITRGLALRESDSREEKLQRLEQAISTVGLGLAETIPLLAPLLNLPLPTRYPPRPLGPELRRERTIDLLSRWVTELAQRQPLVIVFEDLHWIDPSSLDLLARLFAETPRSPLLLLMSARPEFPPPWPLRQGFHIHTLQPLDQAQAHAVVSRLGGRPLPEAAQAMLVARAGGVPLFLEELTKALLESGQLVDGGGAWQLGQRVDSLRVPETLQGSLLARLDRLGAAHELIQVAAVIGREVPRSLLERVCALTPAEMDRQLQQLLAAGLLYAFGEGAEARYVFKHALIQDVARDTLLKEARVALHGRIAESLRRHFADQAQREPQVLGLHYEGAGELAQALRQYQLAGDKAVAAASLAEAIGHFEHALQLLRRLPATPAHHALELDLCLSLGNSRMAALGYGHHTVAPVFERAAELCAQGGDIAQRGRALGNIFLLRYSRAELPAALDLARQVIELGRASGAGALHATGYLQQGWALLNLGRLRECVASCEQGLALFTPETAQQASRAFGHDAITAALMPLVYAYWLMGSPDRALRIAQEAVQKAEAQSNPHSVAWALRSTMPVQVFRRQPESVMRDGARTIELSTRYGLTEWIGFAQQFLGLSRCMLGEVEQGLALLRAANDAKLARGTVAHRSMFAALEAEQCRRAGRPAEAQAAVELGLDHVRVSGERYWEAELHRLRAELLLAAPAPDVEAAVAAFEQALALAREQQARSLELRAATSYAALHLRQGRTAQGRALLEPLYASFTEGLDTQDLVEARELLHRLARS